MYTYWIYYYHSEPHLKGAAPINWAIRLGYKETGLTAFILNDKIDSGDIISSKVVKINNNEKFTTLFNRLSHECVPFTLNVINNILQKEDWQKRLIPQTNQNETFIARKIKQDYFHIYNYDTQSFETLVNSIDDNGWQCQLSIRNDNIIKYINAKIFEVELIGDYYDDGGIGIQTITDCKTFMNITIKNKMYSIKKIQPNGRKVMNIKDFLNGLHFLKNKEEKYIQVILWFMFIIPMRKTLLHTQTILRYIEVLY